MGGLIGFDWSLIGQAQTHTQYTIHNAHLLQTFLYVLSNMAIRGSVQKLCGSGPLRVLEELSNPLLKDEEQ